VEMKNNNYNEEGEIMVNEQVLITSAIGKYKNEVLCNVVPMEETHILFEVEFLPNWEA